MEIERKFLIQKLEELPFSPFEYPHKELEQGYLCTAPVVRIRREDDDYVLTYKSKGLMAREEYNLPLTQESYEHLLGKADGNIITKRRYEIPIEYDYYMPDEICRNNPDHAPFLTIELDIFEGKFAGTVLAEVEFASEEEAGAFIPPDWFLEDVSYSSEYHNSNMSMRTF